MSKYYDTDSWGIDFETFEFIYFKYGQFTIDRFADITNRYRQRALIRNFIALIQWELTHSHSIGPGILIGYVPQ